MLQSLLETAQDRAEHRARAEQDMQFLREKERLSSSTRGVPFATLLESQRSVQDCVEQWERRLSHRTEERKVGALVYRGEWRDGQRFGVHYGYNEQEQLEVVAQFDADKLNGNDMTEIIGSLNTLNPQIIAEKIVENALKKEDGHKDDMTAMALRVVSNSVYGKAKAG